MPLLGRGKYWLSPCRVSFYTGDHMGITLGGGISRGQHAAIPHTNAQISPTAAIDLTKLAVGVWGVIADVELAAAATSISVVNLNLDAHKFYKLLLVASNPAATAVVHLHYNNDLVDANYRHYIGANVNDPTIAFYTTGTEILVEGLISRDAAGRPHYAGLSTEDEGAAFQCRPCGHEWITAANVTRIDVISSVANSFGIGSRLIIMRVSI